MATATTFKDRFYKLFASDLTANTFVDCLLLADEAEAEIVRLRHDAELFAWVLSHPETVAECLQDAAAGDGTARDNIEFRRDALTPND